MLDFLRAEWKTLIVVALAAVGVYFVFQSEDQRDQDAVVADPTVIPGERLGELRIGMPRAELVDMLGQPDTVVEDELGLRALQFPAHSLTVYTHDATVTAIALTLDGERVAPLPSDLIAPGGLDLLDDWSRARGTLGKPLGQLTDDASQTVVRYDGLGVVLETTDDDRKRPVEVTLFAPAP